MKKTLLAIAMTTVFTVPSVFAATLENDDQKLSYSFGLMIAQQMKPNFEKLDIEAFSAAIKDIYSGAELQLAEGEVEASLQKFQVAQAEIQKAAAEAAAEKAKEIIEKNKAEGAKFLAENGKRAEVTTTETGLQVEITAAGTGKQPTAADTVVVHYAGSTLDGNEFDSSIKRGEPATFPLANVIAGWTEGLQLLKEGAKAKLYIPSDLAYGDNGAGSNIQPGATLVFEVELIEVQALETKEEPKKEEAKK